MPDAGLFTLGFDYTLVMIRPRVRNPPSEQIDLIQHVKQWAGAQVVLGATSGDIVRPEPPGLRRLVGQLPRGGDAGLVVLRLPGTCGTSSTLRQGRRCGAKRWIYAVRLCLRGLEEMDGVVWEHLLLGGSGQCQYFVILNWYNFSRAACFFAFHVWSILPISFMVYGEIER